MKTSTKAPAKKIAKAAPKTTPVKATPRPPAVVVIPPGTITAHPADRIHISEHNTRQPTLKEVTDAGLLDSMRVQGQLTPGIGRPHPTMGKGHIELAAGARRSIAAKALGIPFHVVVRPMKDDEFLDIILTENLQRSDPDPEQEAALIELRLKEGVTPAEICARYGKPEIWVKRRMKLLAIVPALRKLLAPGKPLAHFTTAMKERLGALDPDAQKALDKGNLQWNMRQSKTVEDLIQTLVRGSKDLSGADWLKDPDTFIPGCGPGCATDTKASLFPEDGHECGSCTNATCFNKRQAIAIDKAINAARAGVPLSDMILFNSKSYSTCEFEGKQLKLLDRYEFDSHWMIVAVHTGQYALDLANPLKPKRISCKRKAGSKASAAKAGVKESREDRLTAKRLASLNQQLYVAIGAAKRPDFPPILNIVAAFGLNSSRGTCSSETNHAAPWDSLKAANRVSALGNPAHEVEDPSDLSDPSDSPKSQPAGKFTAGSRESVLWHHVKPLLKSRLKVRINKDLMPAWMQQEMKKIAGLIGFDHAGRWHHICTIECPPPKSWGPGVDPLTLIQTRP